MNLTKEHTLNSIQNHLGIPKAKSAEMFGSFLEIMKKTLEDGEEDLSGGFGKIIVKEKKGDLRFWRNRGGSNE